MLNLIVAVSQNGVIGCGGRLAHLISQDLKRFKDLTAGHIVVMGRSTFEGDLNSKPLKNRLNFVLSQVITPHVNDKGVIFVNDSLNVLRTVKGLIINGLPHYADRDIWIIGGSQVYNLFANSVERMYITHIHKSLKGDRFFTPDWSQWQVESEEPQDGFSWVNYARK